jgi:protein-S-isoprenylcysteine O-methyltransferase Ste14
MMLIRHLLAIALLPFVMAVAVPLWLARLNNISFAPSESGWRIAVQFVGLFLLAVGLTLFVTSLRRFAGEGEGTLAPWDPPRRLVISGPYRYVRNPMISGVLFVLFAEALMLLSRPHLAWALAFLVINAIYIPLLEEPMLRERFGAAYDEYCTHVPRLFPRLRPIKGESS